MDVRVIWIELIELWWWRRLLRVLWTARTSNQSILKEISTEYSLEGLMLKPKLQYFGQLMQRADSLEKTLMLGNIREGNGTTLQYSCLENPTDGEAWWATVHGVEKRRTWLSDITFTFHFHALEKEMAAHSSILAWRIPGTGSLVGCHLWGHTELDTTDVT